jgi:hypothetical protein
MLSLKRGADDVLVELRWNGMRNTLSLNYSALHKIKELLGATVHKIVPASKLEVRYGVPLVGYLGHGPF